jgi:hypothetical protein
MRQIFLEVLCDAVKGLTADKAPSPEEAQEKFQQKIYTA